ncbi:MAG: type III-B CRISPR-associated protein Cas10/Cmr2, partial [Cyanobacteria bacterium M5B4]
IEREIIEQQLFPLMENYTGSEPEKFVFWWLWRCLPVAVAKSVGENIALLPAETRIPDSSVWSHNSLVAAIASSLIGKQEEEKSIPYLAVFTLTPVQELIKASRKMRDFWSGSWLLHYLSAKISWRLAEIYGADSLIYPCLYAQPLIDHWLLQKHPELNQWIDQPTDRSLLTAGFPNVLVLLLPKDSVKAAMQTAKQIVKEEWRDLGKKH